MSYGYLVDRVHQNIGCVMNQSLGLGFYQSLTILFKSIDYCLKKDRIKWKYPGVIVLCIPLYTHASFFGNQWIEQHEGGLRLLGDNIPTSALLKEWCDVCQKQCVIEIDSKQKISIAIEKSSCDEIYQYLSQSVSVSKANGIYWFQKESKGLWVSYRCKHRPPSDILSAIKTVMSPMGKHEHMMADDATSFLWVPKRFYDVNQDLITEIDHELPQYKLHISWLRVTEAFIRNYHINNEFMSWLKGTLRVIDYTKMMSWLECHQQQGEISILSEMDLQLRSGEVLKTRLSELLPLEKKDKKGHVYWKDVELRADLEIKTVQLKDAITLDIALQDENEVPGMQQSSLNFKNRISLRSQDSMVLSSFLKNRSYQKRECHGLLSHLPFIGRLFCYYRKEYEKAKYLLVVSLV